MSVVASSPSRREGPAAPRPGPAAPPRSGSARIVGVDVARGLALVGMMAVHIFDTLHADGSPSKTHQLMAGHALATFVLLAGVSLTFVTRRPRSGSRLPDAPTAAGLAARAVVIAAIGLALNSVLDPDVNVILPYYGLMFLLVIPMLRLPSRALIGLSLGLVLLAPLLVLTSIERADLPWDEPALSSLAHPTELWAPLLLTGSYPVVAYLAFICVGMSVGRLDLSSPRVAGRLTAVGVVLAGGAWLISSLLLLRFGGLERLREAAPAGASARQARDIILWDPDTVWSWWWLAERAPYATTPLRMLHDLGIAMAWLGVSLLLTRSRTLRRVLGPVAAAGAMSLTVYTAHVVALSTSFLEDDQVQLFVVLVYVALSFAVLWRRDGRRGPLEALVAWAGTLARERTARRLQRDAPGPRRAGPSR